MDPYPRFLLEWPWECKKTGSYAPSKQDMDETSNLRCGNSLEKNLNRQGCHLAVRQHQAIYQIPFQYCCLSETLNILDPGFQVLEFWLHSILTMPRCHEKYVL